MSTPIRDAVRASIFSSPNAQRIRIPVRFLDTDIELATITVDDIDKMTEQRQNGNWTPFALSSILINYAYVPNTDIKVFDEADREALNQLPYTQEMMDLQNLIAERLLGGSIKAAEKN